MEQELIYVELKTGYSDNGPAWVGFAGYSKSGATTYFNGQAFKSLRGSGISGNYYETESGDEYWISGIKKTGQDRHWAGSGKIEIDKDAVSKYLSTLGISSLPKSFERVILAVSKPSAEHHENENAVLDQENTNVLGRRAIKKTINKLSG